MDVAPFRKPHANPQTNSPASNCGDASKGKSNKAIASCTIANAPPCNHAYT